ncbi:TPA: hypothetical protein ACX3C4_000429 [Pasteurella multocida]
MSFLIRKITKSKWKNSNDPQGCEELEISKLSSDAITSCLRTSKNALSFWEVSDISKESNLENNIDLKNVILALLTSSKSEDISTLDIVFFEKNEELLKENGISLDKTDGDTIDDNLKSFHIDLCNLNHKNLTFIANTMCTCLNEEYHIRFTKNSLKELLKSHLQANMGLMPKLTPKLREKLGCLTAY